MRTLLFVLSFVLLTVGAAQLRLDLLPESNVVYTASRPGETWSGQAPLSSGTFLLEPENVRASEFTLELAPQDFDSGSVIRDLNARRTVFETATYPLIRFQAERIVTADNRLAFGTPQSVKLGGTLLLHGVTHKVDTEATVTWDGERLEAEGGFTLKLSDYDVNRPSFFGVTVDDEVSIDFSLYASRP